MGISQNESITEKQLEALKGFGYEENTAERLTKKEAQTEQLWCYRMRRKFPKAKDIELAAFLKEEPNYNGILKDDGSDSPKPNKADTLSFRDAVIKILKDKKTPIHYLRITELAIEEGLIDSKGKTPNQTVSSLLNLSIRKEGAASPFIKSGRGLFALNPAYKEE